MVKKGKKEWKMPSAPFYAFKLRKVPLAYSEKVYMVNE